MERFARIIVGYHGCSRKFADDLLTRRTSPNEWNASQNEYDWLGRGIYFWEHSPARALRWAQENFGADEAAVIGAVVQLGSCFDLLDESITSLLRISYEQFAESYRAEGKSLPQNKGKDKKLRELDCAVINDCLGRLADQGIQFDTVRGAFLEGTALFPGTTISAETHIQIAVRNADCIIGIFLPNLSV